MKPKGFARISVKAETYHRLQRVQKELKLTKPTVSFNDVVIHLLEHQK